MAREEHELTDEQWARLAPLLPPQKSRTGRPAKDHRTVVEALCWLGRSGAPWRDLPAEYGPWRTVASRFYRWEQQGVWARVLAALQAQAEARGEPDWLLHYLDSTIVRTHQHAAGAKGGTRRRKRSGAVGAGSAPSSTSALRAEAARSASC
jgi:transposase